MCGLVGIAGWMTGREETTMKKLLHLDSLRGMDSTGMASIRMGGVKVELAKTASHHFNLFDKKQFQEALNGNTSQVFIGHNRAATSGAIKDVNAHPFTIGHITGAHNGTLEDSDKKMLEEWVGEKFNVDSEALFAAIAKFGVKEVIPKLKKGRDTYRGAWSLTWWDSNDKTLNFVRNEHRPLWYCFSKDLKLMFWASEFWMLDAALVKTGNYELHSQASKAQPEKSFRFFQTSSDLLYTIDVDKLSKGGTERPKFHVVKLAGKEPEAATQTSYPFTTVASGTHGNVCGRIEGTSAHTQGSKSSTNRKNSTPNSSGEPATLTLVGDVRDPYAGYFTEIGFSFLGTHQSGTGPQCSWCHEKIPYGQPGIFVTTRDNVILCAKCNNCEPVSSTSDYAPASRVYLPRAAFNELR